MIPTTLGVIAFGSIWPALLASIHACAAIEPRLLEVERMLGLTRWRGIVEIAPPSATPGIIAGLTLGLTASLILAVVCETIADLDGLGRPVLLAARAYRSPDIFAGVALLGAFGGRGARARLAFEQPHVNDAAPGLTSFPVGGTRASEASFVGRGPNET